MPAIGVYQQIGLDPASLPNIEAGAYLEQLRDLPPTRDGTLRHLDLLGLSGIVTFPSFHAASAVLYSWALWGARWIRPIVVVANGALLLRNADRRRSLFHRHFRRRRHRGRGDRGVAAGRTDGGAPASRLRCGGADPARRAG